VIAEGIEPKSNFPFGRQDGLQERPPRGIRDARQQGRARNINPVAQGFDPNPRHREAQSVVPSGSPDLYLPTVRSPANQAHLASAIIGNSEYAVDGSNRGRRWPRRGCPTPARRLAIAPASRYSLTALVRSHRLAVQDVALSRRKQGFDSPWERQRNQGVVSNFDCRTGSVPNICPISVDRRGRTPVCSRGRAMHGGGLRRGEKPRDLCKSYHVSRSTIARS
jgi:hypothetical protein